MNEQILAALKMLNGDKDAHWTKDGKPSLEMVRALSKNPTVTRELLDTTFPNWTRSNVVNGTVESVADDAAKSVEGEAAPSNEPAVQPLPAQTPAPDISQDVKDAEAETKERVNLEEAMSVSEGLARLSDEELEGLLETLATYKAEFVSERDHIDSQIFEVNRRSDMLVLEKERRVSTKGAKDEQENIMAALNASLAQREEAFNRRRALIEAGVNSDAIRAVVNPLNAVDAALPRRR